MVTGATGFLGSRLVAALADAGHSVRALVRPTSDLRRLEGVRVKLVRGDLADAGSLSNALRGARWVFHAAARVADWGPRADFVRVNVEGTRSLIAACQTSGVQRLIHVSSLTVLGLPRSGIVVDEETPYGRPRDPYSETKLAGERLVRESHGQVGLETTVVRPGVIWGLGDALIIPRLLELLRRSRMVLISGGANTLALSHVTNLTQGLLRAATTPRAAGQVYHVIDEEQLTARDALDGLADAFGVPRARRSLPFWAIYGAASLLEGAARLTGRSAPPLLTRYGVRLVACDCRYHTGKAREELGYFPTITYQNGLAELVNAGAKEENP